MFKKGSLDKCIAFPVIISATSAAGKDCLLSVLKEELKNAVVVKRLTTRNKRNGEENSINYKFVNKDYIYSIFRQKKLLFLEENYGGKLYGVLKNEVEDLLDAGKIPIIVANITEGVKQIQQIYPDGLFIYIAPISEDLKWQLSSSSETIKSRSQSKLVNSLKLLITKRKRGDFDINSRVNQALEDTNYLDGYDTIIYNSYHSKGIKSKQFKVAYERLKQSIVKEILYRKFLSKFLKHSLNRKNLRQLRLLRKQGIKEKLLELNLFLYQNKDERIKKSVEFISSYLGPNLPILSVFNQFRYWSKISRLKLIKEEEKIFSYAPEQELLSISEGVCSPDISRIEIKKIIDKENLQKQKISAEITGLIRLQTIAQGGFEENSVLFPKMARKMLKLVKKINLLEVTFRYAYSKNWYERRLASEVLGKIESYHPSREKILTALLDLSKDIKVGQINKPALIGLANLAHSGYKVSIIKGKVLALIRDPHRAWVRREILDVLGEIGDRDCLSAIFEELGNTERFDNRLAALENLQKFKKSKQIYTALTYIAEFDQLSEVRKKAQQIIQENYKSKVFSNQREDSNNNLTLLLSKSWMQRISAIMKANSLGTVDDKTLVKGLTNRDWKIRYASLHLLKYSQISLTEELAKKIIQGNYPSLRAQLLNSVSQEKQNTYSDINGWLKSDNPWLRIIGIQAMAIKKRIYKKQASQTMLEQIKSNKNSATKNVILSGLIDIIKMDNNKSVLNRSKLTKKRFTQTINQFNQLLSSKHLGFIKQVIFEDSSFSKTPAVFMLGSDFDVFRIIFVGKIPIKYRVMFRDLVWSLGVYIKPDEPEWWNEKDSYKMFKTAVDVSVYQRPKSLLIRTATNDFVDKKTELRNKLLNELKRKTLSCNESTLIYSLQRIYALQKLYGVREKLQIEKKIDLDSLKQLRDRGYLVFCKTDATLLRLNWMTFSGIYINYYKLY